MVMMKDNAGFTLLHNLQHMDCKIWTEDPISGKIVAFGRDVCPSDATPNVFVFDEEEENLFVRVHLPPAPLLQTIKKYNPSLGNDQNYAFVRESFDDKMDTIASTWMVLIFMEWVPMFVNCPNFGTVIHWLVDLFDLIEKLERDHLMPLLKMVALVCCGRYTLPTAISTLSTCLTQLKYHATTRKWAEEVWLVHLHDMSEEDSQSSHSLSHASLIKGPDDIFHARPRHKAVTLASPRQNGAMSAHWGCHDTTMDMSAFGNIIVKVLQSHATLKKSSIGGNQYLEYLWELGELPVYTYWWCWRFCPSWLTMVCPW